MITDFETNTVYFSELIRTDARFVETSKQISKVLDSFGVNYKFLPNTKDIWPRDFMPIQISDSTFIEYRYDPDYLQGSEKGYRNLKTYPDIVCNSIKLKTEKTDLILDGGNMIKSPDCIILTDKIVNENKHSYTKKELIRKLQNTFQIQKVVLIPWDKAEPYGHSDGVLRFIDNETVLVSHYYKTDTVLKYRLKQGGLKYEFLDFKGGKVNKQSWAYINFLQTKDILLIPKLGIDEDGQALDQIIEYYPSYKTQIAQVEMNDIVKFDGALNCITWTTKE
ncbi:MAG: agmatine deiminase family protein [Bacteroidales bacterium]